MTDEIRNIQKQEARRTRDVERTRDEKVFIPRTDIYEREDAIVVTADMPGVDNNSVEINLERNELTITGHVGQKPVEGHSLSYSEYEVGDYRRTFKLSNEIDGDKIDASIKNGVLRIVLPKAEEVKPKRIAVKAN